METPNQNQTTSIGDDIAEGKALGKMWRQINDLKQTVKANGFDTRLGKLLQKLKASSPVDSGQISRQTLVTHGINDIDKRRRSEALWFADNEVECREFIAKGKFKGSSLTALKAAMHKAANPVTLVSPEVKAEPAEQPTAKAEVSNVGPNPNLKVTPTLVVDKMMDIVKANGLDLEEIIEMLMVEQERLEAELDADDPVDAANTLIAAKAVKAVLTPSIGIPV
tara:strand:- start:80 stop:748 length:669 start_codon:yes stop_codon:yes gene_type:complete